MLRVVVKLRNVLRKWLGVVDPPETIETEAKRRGFSIASAVLARAGEKNVTHRRFAPPVLPAGVIPTNTNFASDPGGLGPYLALDSELNAPAYAYANQFNCGLGFPGYAYLAELTQRSEYRAPSETIASEMTREWIKVIVNGKAKRAEGAGKDVDGDSDKDGGLDDKVEKITEAIEEFKIRDHFRKLAELDGFFGRAQLFIDVRHNGRAPEEERQLPLCVDKTTIPKGSLCGFKVIEPIWTTPFSYNATDPMVEDFYKPKAWFVLGKRVHASRLLTFISREVPDMLKPAYNFGGISMTQLMEADVFQSLRTRNSISDLVHNFSVMVLKTDMTNILSGEPDKPGGLMDRIRLFIASRDNQGCTVLDKDKEEMEQIAVPLAGLGELQAQSLERLAAPSHIPLVKLLGITPGGLNASTEGEIAVFYDFVRACQQVLFAAHLNTVIQLIQLHLFGEIDNAISFEFLELTAPTVKELSEIRKADAETASTYVTIGAISPEEVRERVASDPDSGYSNLSGEAPEPPDMTMTQTQHDLGEESAENAHERTMEQQANEPKVA